LLCYSEKTPHQLYVTCNGPPWTAHVLLDRIVAVLTQPLGKDGTILLTCPGDVVLLLMRSTRACALTTAPDRSSFTACKRDSITVPDPEPVFDVDQLGLAFLVFFVLVLSATAQLGSADVG
jgi:hypothetical protein